MCACDACVLACDVCLLVMRVSVCVFVCMWFCVCVCVCASTRMACARLSWLHVHTMYALLALSRVTLI